MFKTFLRWWSSKPSKKIAFLDADQPLPGVLSAYNAHLADTNTEVHLVRMRLTGTNEPKRLRDIDSSIIKTYLEDVDSAEAVDKFITAGIQRAVSDGYQEITVVSSDYGFLDIFKMITIINQDAIKIKFRLIVPVARGKLANVPNQVMNIEVIKQTTRQ